MTRYIGVLLIWGYPLYRRASTHQLGEQSTLRRSYFVKSKGFSYHTPTLTRPNVTVGETIRGSFKGNDRVILPRKSLIARPPGLLWRSVFYESACTGRSGLGSNGEPICAPSKKTVFDDLVVGYSCTVHFSTTFFYKSQSPSNFLEGFQPLRLIAPWSDGS